MQQVAIKKPYIVSEVAQEQIYDFHNLAENFSWKKVNVSIIKELKVASDVENFIEIKRHFEDDFRGRS